MPGAARLPNGIHKVATPVDVPHGVRVPGSFIEDAERKRDSAQPQESKKITKRKLTEIDPHVESLLKSIVVGKHVLQLQKDTPVFSQGDRRTRSILFSPAG